MKAQAVNVDFIIATGLFMTSVLAGTLLLWNQGSGPNTVAESRQKASLVHQNLEEESFIEARQAPLYFNTPVNLSHNIPVDREYVFHQEAFAGSGAMDVPADINVSGQRVITVARLENSSHELTYFFSNRSNRTHTNQIDTGSWMNNSKIAALPGSPGLDSLRINGQEVLNETADLNGNSFSVTESDLHAHSLSGDLNLYNDTTELILKNSGEVTFKLKNFTTLHWRADNSTTALVGTGTFKDSTTDGFTVASDHGVTFSGDSMDVTVSKPDTTTVEADIDTSRLRIFLHDSDYVEGRRRTLAFRDGNVFFGTEEKLEGASQDEIDELDGLSNSSFQNRVELENFAYNISYGSMKRGIPIPLGENVVVDDRPSVLLGREGNFSSIENEVAVWR